MISPQNAALPSSPLVPLHLTLSEAALEVLFVAFFSCAIVATLVSSADSKHYPPCHCDFAEEREDFGSRSGK